MKRFLMACLGTLVMIMPPASAADLTERSQIEQIAAIIAGGADRHDWSQIRAVLADTITTDYTSLFGGKPVTQPADDLLKSWSTFLPGFDSTHHMIASLIVANVEDNSATAQANFTATHRIDDSLWVLGGRYNYDFSKTSGNWRLTSLTMTALWETGDRNLIQLASKRAKASD